MLSPLWVSAAMLLVAAQPDAPLRLEELISEAVRSNPELRAMQKRVESAQAKPAQESALPAPVLSVGYTSNGNPLPGYGIGREPTSNAGFMVTQELPYPGKRDLMRGIANKEAAAELQVYRSAERALIARLKQAFHRLHHSTELIEVMERSRSLLVKFIETAEIRYAAGKAMQQDIFKARTQLAVLETRILKMRQDGVLAKAEINTILNRRLDAPLGNPLHMDPRPLTAPMSELAAAAEATSPAIAREQKMAEARQLGVSLARKNFYPDMAVSGGYFYMGRMPDMFQFRLDIKLPAWRSRERAALTGQVQSLEQARRTFEAAVTDVRWRVNEAYVAAQTSWRLIEIYRETVIPQAAITVESSLAGFTAGTADSLPVLMNLMSAVEQEERLHEESLEYFRAVIQLEELTGMELL